MLGVKKEAKKEMEFEFEGEKVIREEDYVDLVADIPECRERTDLETEYKDHPEENIWTPNEGINKLSALYMFMARSALTYMQEQQGVPNQEAMENSCAGNAEQHINDTLHECDYCPGYALNRLLSEVPPLKIYKKWSDTDADLFTKGVNKYGKSFKTIQKNLLPQKHMKEIVEFYYTWKWTKAGKEMRNRHRRRSRSNKPCFPLGETNLEELSSSKIMTRSVASRLSMEKNETTPVPSTSKDTVNIYAPSTSKASDNFCVSSASKAPDNLYLSSTSKAPDNLYLSSTSKAPDNLYLSSTSKASENYCFPSTSKASDDFCLPSASTKASENYCFPSTSKAPEDFYFPLTSEASDDFCLPTTSKASEDFCFPLTSKASEDFCCPSTSKASKDFCLPSTSKTLDYFSISAASKCSQPFPMPSTPASSGIFDMPSTSAASEYFCPPTPETGDMFAIPSTSSAWNENFVTKRKRKNPVVVR